MGGTPNSVLFVGSAGTISQDANFTYDGTILRATTLAVLSAGSTRLTVSANGSTTSFVAGLGNLLSFSGVANSTATSTIINFTNLSPFSTNSSGVSQFFTITPVINSSGTAGNTDLFVNRNQVAVGSGSQRLIDLQTTSVSQFGVTNAGKILLREGTNGSQGVATLIAGTLTVNTTAVTANSRIMLTPQNTAGTASYIYVSARVAATSFTITSGSAADLRDIAWQIFDAA